MNAPVDLASGTATGGARVDLTERAISRALGEELRRTREARGWSRAQLVGMLPSGIGDRTLLSYEHGTRHLTVLRLIELCNALGVAADTVVAHALQRARIHLENQNLRIDLRVMLRDSSDKFRPMAQWARNKLNETPDGIAELAPAAARELAIFAGYTVRELADYLAMFVPDDTEATNSE
ncbi:helix-turn-helix domain-containing protein [Actinophytocola sp.]|uniref:helix-turn-helix domain-containing protein n=1 Tax=Actinophytocola sp. TaxID=1872138 RepID=UPI00389A97FF